MVCAVATCAPSPEGGATSPGCCPASPRHRRAVGGLTPRGDACRRRRPRCRGSVAVVCRGGGDSPEGEPAAIAPGGSTASRQRVSSAPRRPRAATHLLPRERARVDGLASPRGSVQWGSTGLPQAPEGDGLPSVPHTAPFGAESERRRPEERRRTRDASCRHETPRSQTRCDDSRAPPRRSTHSVSA